MNEKESHPTYILFVLVIRTAVSKQCKYHFQVRSLCRDWFPIEYPQSWYEDITSSERFFALAAVHKSQIIGLIVAEIKPYLKLNAEDRGILSRWFASKDTLVAYILSLGKSFICSYYYRHLALYKQ